MEKHDVTSVASIVFISVASIKDPGIQAGHFALVRMVDTFVGIGVSLIVNITIADTEELKQMLNTFYENLKINMHK